VSRYHGSHGLEIHQTSGYIRTSCETYIDRVLISHGWDASPSKETGDITPIRTYICDRLMSITGPAEHTKEAKELAAKHKFGYRNLLGELVYPFVLCRIDISFGVSFLSRFSAAPHDEHYIALKGILKYLRKYKKWGIYYKRNRPRAHLPAGKIVFLPMPEGYRDIAIYANGRLYVLVDAAHATDKVKRRSVTGVAVMLRDAAIAYKSKLQPLIASSSTEAEFYSASDGAKMAIYMRSILEEMGLPQTEPTPIGIDNSAVIDIADKSAPTSRVRHVEIRFFQMQQFITDKLVQFFKVPGTSNAIDSATKPLASPAHLSHSRFLMNHYSRPSVTVETSSSATTEVGEGVSDRKAGLVTRD
jgi:hypothetical protein